MAVLFFVAVLAPRDPAPPRRGLGGRIRSGGPRRAPPQSRQVDKPKQKVMFRWFMQPAALSRRSVRATGPF